MIYDPSGDLYSRLGAPATAGMEAIRDAWRRKVREVHPDVRGDDPEATQKTQLLNEAYEILSDPRTRTEYDRARAQHRMQKWAELTRNLNVRSGPPSRRSTTPPNTTISKAAPAASRGPFTPIGEAVAKQMAIGNPMLAVVVALTGIALDAYLDLR